MRVSLLALLSLLSFSVACSNARTDGSGGDPLNSDAGTQDQQDAGPVVDDPYGPYPAPHPNPPQVVNLGGEALKSPKIVPIFFSNYIAREKQTVIDFEKQIGVSEYWKAATEEYGVGPAEALPAVELDESATGTITDQDVQNWIKTKLDSDDPKFPAPDENSIYVIHYPAGVTITESGGQGGQSCRTFGGYHSEFKLNSFHGGYSVAYAVLPHCNNFNGLSGADMVTGAESHELVEAATDPYPNTDPAYAQLDDDHLYWLFILGGGETGDMCAQDPSAFTQFDDLPFIAQRSWSNEAAMAGHDPCQPALPGEVYFAAVPDMSDPIEVSFGQGQSYQMTGVTLAQGESKTIDLDLFSDGPTSGAWRVQVEDVSRSAAVRRRSPSRSARRRAGTATRSSSRSSVSARAATAWTRSS